MKKIIFYVSLISIISLTSCKSIDDYREERVTKADLAFKKIISKKIPDGTTLTLPYCIELALKNNLDLKIYQLKAAVDKEKKTAAALGMLPDLIITNDTTYRTNEPGAQSVYLTGPQQGQTSLAYSKSTSPFENRVRAELIFSVIDFGLAFCNYIQQDDKSILTTELNRRAAQNLILDVTRSYLRVAAAQYAMLTTEKMITLSIKTEQTLQDMAKNKTVSIASVLEENKKFIVLKKALMEYKRSYKNSCIELRSLMGYYPLANIKVDTTPMIECTELFIPNVELLEEISLIERPELYQLDIQHHITVIEARKTIITMFPNVQIFLDFSNSTNPYLYNYSWAELGTRAAYNLLKLPQKIEQYYALDAEADQLKAQALALSVGIIAQVRIAHANLSEVKDRYQLSEDLLGVYKQHEQVIDTKAKSAGSLSEIELSRVQIETEQRAIERTQALANYYLSYFRLLNSVGIGSFDKAELSEIKERIEKAMYDAMSKCAEDKAEYNEEISELQITIDDCNKKIDIAQLEIDTYWDTIDNTENKENITNKIADLNEDIRDYKETIQTNEKAKSPIITKLDKITDEVAAYNARLANYDKEIKRFQELQNNKTTKENPLLKKYEEVMDLDPGAKVSGTTNKVVSDHGTLEDVGTETVASNAAEPIASINMEMQQDAGNNNISSQEFAPKSSNNIIVEAQQDAARGIFQPTNTETFNVSEPSIGMEAQLNTGGNTISAEEFNNRIPDSTITPGRSGY